MQTTSALYKSILSDTNHWFEVSLATGKSGVLVTEDGYDLTFGGYSIIVASSDADGGYRESTLMSMSTTRELFPDGKPAVGGAIAGELDVTMLKPSGEITKMARLVPYCRVTDGTQTSEWIQKGVYYIDTRSYDESAGGDVTMTIHAYDDMLKAEMDYVPTINFPAADINVINDIAEMMGVTLDSRTTTAISEEYTINLPTGYSCREMLGYIAAMYGGNFIMSDTGRLLFIRLGDIAEETNYVIDYNGDVLVWDDTMGATGELLKILL